MKRGGEDYIGWGMNRILLSGIYDAINVGSSVNMAVNGVKKPPKFEQWPSPWVAAKKAEEKPVTVDDLYAIMTGGKGLRRG